MPTHRTDAYLNVVRASLAADERLDADTRHRFATMPEEELADIWSLVAKVQSLPEREKAAAKVIAHRLAEGDQALLEKLHAVERGELPPEQVMEEVLA